MTDSGADPVPAGLVPAGEALGGLAPAGLALAAQTLCPGEGSGALLVLSEPLSFWGGTDRRTGMVVDTHHPQHGTSIAGRVLLMDASRGSSSSSSVLAEQIRAGVGPAAVLLTARDAIVALGALAAAELYGTYVPVVLVDAGEASRLGRRNGTTATVRAGEDGRAGVVLGLAPAAVLPPRPGEPA